MLSREQESPFHGMFSVEYFGHNPLKGPKTPK